MSGPTDRQSENSERHNANRHQDISEILDRADQLLDSVKEQDQRFNLELSDDNILRMIVNSDRNQFSSDSEDLSEVLSSADRLLNRISESQEEYDSELSDKNILRMKNMKAEADYIKSTSEFLAREFVVRAITIAFIVGVFTLPLLATSDLWCEGCIDNEEFGTVFSALKELFLPVVALVYGYYFGAMRDAEKRSDE